jgi:hypothetical protein
MGCDEIFHYEIAHDEISRNEIFHDMHSLHSTQSYDDCHEPSLHELHGWQLTFLCISLHVSLHVLSPFGHHGPL